jgi:hypothetical protein
MIVFVKPVFAATAQSCGSNAFLKRSALLGGFTWNSAWVARST